MVWSIAYGIGIYLVGAATAAIISLKSSLRDDPVRFNADHPFVFFLLDRQTGCIIFTGRLVKPS